MVYYECYRCGYTVTHKSKMKLHLARKKRCESDYNDIDLDVCKDYIMRGIQYDEYLKISESKQPVNKKSTISQHSLDNLVQSVNKKSTISQHFSHQCEYCEKQFSHKQSYYRHLKVCKKKKEDDETKNDEEAKKSMTELVNLLNDQLNDYKKQLEKRDKQIDELIKKAGITNHNTITQNIQNNIKLLAYDSTDVSNLTDNDYLQCLKHNNMCVPHLIKMIHLDPEKPENHNIYISNLKNGYIMVYDGSKWDTKNRDELIDQLIDSKQGLIEEKIENWIEDGRKYPAIMKKFERYIQKKENDIVIDKIKEEIKLMLFNNRSLIKKDKN